MDDLGVPLFQETPKWSFIQSSVEIPTQKDRWCLWVVNNMNPTCDGAGSFLPTFTCWQVFMNKEVHKEHLDQLESLEFQGGWSTWVDFGCYMYVYITYIYIYKDVCVCVSLSLSLLIITGLLDC